MASLASEIQNWLSDITQGFHWSPSAIGGHSGVDIGLAQGTPLETPVGGTLLSQGWEPWGGQVNVKTDLPGYGNVVESFLHLSQLSPYQPGQAIPAGAFIGDSGGAGLPAQYSNGPHLHYELTTGTQAPYVSSYSPGIDPTASSHPIDPLPVLQSLLGSTAGTAAGAQITAGSGGGCSNDTPVIGWIGTAFCNLSSGAQNLFAAILAVVERGGVILGGAALIVLALVFLLKGS